ncbi:MAG: hypothetical protein ACFE7E_06835 [Candidatus Hodarchaeota archaeon]
MFDRFTTRAWAYLVVTIGIIILVGLRVFLPLISIRISAIFDTSLYSQFFSVGVAAVATTLAISSSLILVVVQNSAAQYSPEILTIYKKDSVIWGSFVFFLSVIAFGLLNISNTSPVMLDIGFVMFVSYFVVLSLELYFFPDMINPKKIIDRVKQRTLASIRKIGHEVMSDFKDKINTINKKNEVVEIMSRLSSESLEKILSDDRDLMRHQVILHQAYREKLHKPNGFQSEIDNEVALIFDIILKACRDLEFETYDYGFSSVLDITNEYIKIRKDDLTNYDAFLERISNMLEAASRLGFSGDNFILLERVADVFGAIGTESIKRLRVGIVLVEPLTRRMTNIAVKCAESGYPTVVTVLVRALKEIALESVKSKYHNDLGIMKSIAEIEKVMIQHNLKHYIATMNSYLMEIGYATVALRLTLAEDFGEQIQDIYQEVLSHRLDGGALAPLFDHDGFNKIFTELINFINTYPTYSRDTFNLLYDKTSTLLTRMADKDNVYPELQYGKTINNGMKIISDIASYLMNRADWGIEYQKVVTTFLAICEEYRSNRPDVFVPLLDNLYRLGVKIIDLGEKPSKSHLNKEITRVILENKGTHIASYLTVLLITLGLYADDKQMKNVKSYYLKKVRYVVKEKKLTEISQVKDIIKDLKQKLQNLEVFPYYLDLLSSEWLSFEEEEIERFFSKVLR